MHKIEFTVYSTVSRKEQWKIDVPDKVVKQGPDAVKAYIARNGDDWDDPYVIDDSTMDIDMSSIRINTPIPTPNP